MIIDLILNRKDGHKYDPHEFYIDVMNYANSASDRITRAMDYGKENIVKAELIHYVLCNDYNPQICNYILSVDWL